MQQQVQIKHEICYECYALEGGIAIVAAVIATVAGIYIRRQFRKRKEKSDAEVS